MKNNGTIGGYVNKPFKDPKYLNYDGGTTETIDVKIDQENRVITADVIASYATPEDVARVSAALGTLNEQVQEIDSQVQQTAEDVTAINGEIDNIKVDLATKADEQAFEDLVQEVSDSINDLYGSTNYWYGNNYYQGSIYTYNILPSNSTYYIGSSVLSRHYAGAYINTLYGSDNVSKPVSELALQGWVSSNFLSAATPLLSVVNWGNIQGSIANQQDLTQALSSISSLASAAQLTADIALSTASQATAGLSGKQDILVSGNNIKTIHGESILGSGNIDIVGPKGDKGDPGEGFAIYKTYASIEAMNADAANVPEGKFVLITSNVEDPDNSKLFVKNGEGTFTFLTDMSGAQGIQGPKGDDGAPGEKGADGRGLNFKSKGSECLIIGDCYIDDNGYLQVLTALPSTFTNLGYMIGPKGDKGDKGDKGERGEPGYVTYFVPNRDSVTQVGEAYVDETGHMFVCTNIDPLEFQDCGYIRGPRGYQGERGYTPYIDANTGNWFINGSDTGVHAQGERGETGYVKGFKYSQQDIEEVGEAYVDENGNLYICTSLDPLTFIAHGNIKGPEGPAGPQGPEGPAGYVRRYVANRQEVQEVGDAYLDYSNGHLYVCTSIDPVAFDDVGNIRGPQGIQGIQGIQGPKGDQGERGEPGYVKGFYYHIEDIQEVGDAYVDEYCHLKICTSLNPLEFEDRGDIRGPQGIQGIQGERGETGYVRSYVPDRQSVTAVGQAYVDEYNRLQVCVAIEPDFAFVDCGDIRGPQGPQGIQGPQGEQGPQGLKGDPGQDGTIVSGTADGGNWTSITINGVTNGIAGGSGGLDESAVIDLLNDIFIEGNGDQEDPAHCCIVKGYPTIAETLLALDIELIKKCIGEPEVDPDPQGEELTIVRLKDTYGRTYMFEATSENTADVVIIDPTCGCYEGLNFASVFTTSISYERDAETGDVRIIIEDLEPEWYPEGGGSSAPTQITYLNEAPTQDNDEGKLSYVILDDEPEHKYEGYIYIIKNGEEGGDDPDVETINDFDGLKLELESLGLTYPDLPDVDRTFKFDYSLPLTNAPDYVVNEGDDPILALFESLDTELVDYLLTNLSIIADLKGSFYDVKVLGDPEAGNITTGNVSLDVSVGSDAETGDSRVVPSYNILSKGEIKVYDNLSLVEEKWFRLRHLSGSIRLYNKSENGGN